jgi:hypothetical protein
MRRALAGGIKGDILELFSQQGQPMGADGLEFAVSAFGRSVCSSPGRLCWKDYDVSLAANSNANELGELTESSVPKTKDIGTLPTLNLTMLRGAE